MGGPAPCDRARLLLYRLLELNMTDHFDDDSLHRTAKYFMDTGRAERPEDAVALLATFGLSIAVGAEVATSPLHQIALLTLVNTARRTFLAGVEVFGITDCEILVPLAKAERLADAVRELGGTPVTAARPGWPCAIIGSVSVDASAKPAWQLTWQGWRAGVTPASRARRLDEARAISLAPALAAAICAAEVFAHHAGDHPMAGKRDFGLSLWDFTANWLDSEDGPDLAFLPSKLWLIGLGNLGQVLAWLIACMPYRDHRETEIVLQDFDKIAVSNDSTSLLSSLEEVGRRKARVVGSWLDRAGFQTVLEERRFGSTTCRGAHEPGVALCGVDNGAARMALEDAGFDLIVEIGLGGGPEAFRSMALHTFPATRTAREIWSGPVVQGGADYEALPAYRALKDAGLDECGLAQLASRTVGVPFVGLIAACLAISELLRRLNGGQPLEFAAGSAAALEFETGDSELAAYAHGYTEAVDG
jgi:hypothetical protein